MAGFLSVLPLLMCVALLCVTRLPCAGSDDPAGAVDELERLHREYRQLPWRSQVMAHLIRQENTDQ